MNQDVSKHFAHVYSHIQADSNDYIILTSENVIDNQLFTGNYHGQFLCIGS